MKLSSHTNHTKITHVAGEILKDNRIISSLSNHPAADVFNILRTKVLAKMHANNWNVLAVTSPRAGVGKSFTAINLAISIAMEEDHSALLADFDFKNPSLHEYFGITPKQGLSDFFNNDIPLSELLVRPDIESLALLPAGKQIRGSSELFSSSRMLQLVSELKGRYSDRIIVVDLPPLLGTADAMTFLPIADACLLVVAEGETTIDDIEQSMRLMDKNKLLGSVLNKSTETIVYL
jgi:capsular exopolysaccharide synthesis family protein